MTALEWPYNEGYPGTLLLSQRAGGRQPSSLNVGSR
jgi:hypothetical protein